MNGRVQGNFLGRKGLRQGDPISPLLSVLVMEYFTRLLIEATQTKDFKYHPSCKKLKLVILCFVDDLVLFCKGADASVQIIKDSFKSFSLASRLTANLDKSRVYFGGMAEKETKSILERLHFAEATFPIKYLGIPHRPTKWKAGDCAAIIKKIHMKLHHWSSRHLSFAGRAQLINSVLLGIDAIYLKGESFWDYKIHSDVSWYWCKLVNLKSVITAEVLEKSVKNNKVNVSNLYVQLLNKEKVSFAHVVWCNLTLPKHKFILWQATLGHLLTTNNLVRCHMQLNSVMCPTCDMQQESHDHLFFQCQFSQLVRIRIAEWLGNAIWPVQFKDRSSWMMGKPKGLKKMLAAAALAASVYLIWWNRNNCLFNFCSMTVDKFIYLLKVYLKARVAKLSRTKLKSKDLAFLEKLSLM
ncbi:uncharacterized protein LOC133814390 [Humulus lupulus]|uniref:uncharacterized protein LOC133814390 n=1 Tax=Humulus lupulus TaxID=3486 RepID=UPI002B41557D|nr:uncharacterized protein LOC133814390 [Humulus lupulus]